MKYLITGITGFAAPQLAAILHNEGHEVYGLSRRTNGMQTDILDAVSQNVYSSINFVYGDITDYNSLVRVFKRDQFNGCFHLAAQSNPPISLTDPVGTFNTNIMGSANLIQVISEYNPECKLCFVSTSEVYGNEGKDGRLIKETDVIAPSNPYGVSKASIDLYMQERMTNNKIRGFITRAFSHTGIRRGINFSISSDAYQIARIMKGYQSPILEVGNLDSVRVVIDVKDTMMAYYLLMINPNSNGQAFNVCGDVPRKMAYFTDYLISLSGITIEKRISDKYYRPIDIYYQHGDTTKLKELTGWQPKIPIEETLSGLLDYWLKNI
jgi:GDP-4-dehydro-6-deoxy-D-mannose reductase